MSTRLTLEGVGSFIHVFQPKAVGGQGDPKYSVQLVIPGNDPQWPQINAAVQEAITEKFGATPPAGLHLPITDPQSKPELATKPFYQGKYYINCNAREDNRPVIVDVNNQDIVDPSQLYSGCHVRVAVSFYGYDTMGNKGVAVGLNGIQKVADGERLDNRQTKEEMFGAAPAAAPAGFPGQPAPAPAPAPVQPAPAAGPAGFPGQAAPAPAPAAPGQPAQRDPVTGLPITYPPQH